MTQGRRRQQFPPGRSRLGLEALEDRQLLAVLAAPVASAVPDTTTAAQEATEYQQAYYTPGQYNPVNAWTNDYGRQTDYSSYDSYPSSTKTGQDSSSATPENYQTPKTPAPPSTSSSASLLSVLSPPAATVVNSAVTSVPHGTAPATPASTVPNTSATPVAEHAVEGPRPALVHVPTPNAAEEVPPDLVAELSAPAGVDPVDRPTEAPTPAPIRAAGFAPQVADLLAGSLPVNPAAVEQGIERFLQRVEDLREEPSVLPRGLWLAPWFVGVSGATLAFELARRQLRKQPLPGLIPILRWRRLPPLWFPDSDPSDPRPSA